MFLICDHYEPKHKVTRDNQDIERVSSWVDGYPEFAKQCLSEFGHYPLHSWFYPPHHGYEHIDQLNRLVYHGYGELELHYHHDNDTSEKFFHDMTDVIKIYNRKGALLTSGNEIKSTFAFIHGDWALDNSAHGKYCGVNDELTILDKIGCWGDFTMPSAEECQTRKINSIYYAVDNPHKPKSHDTGKDARVGKTNPEGLFMLQGPLGINWKRSGLPKVENASITDSNWGREDRVKYWIKSNVHVKGKPEWKFIKLHTHGAVERDHDALFGKKALQMHRYLNQYYNDGTKYKLHYVTARQAYNICKAAEAGMTGDPDLFLDYVIPPYSNHFYHSNQEHILNTCTDNLLSIDFPSTENHEIELLLRAPFIEKVTGDFVNIQVDKLNNIITLQKVGRISLSTTDGFIVKIIKPDYLANQRLEKEIINFNKKQDEVILEFMCTDDI